MQGYIVNYGAETCSLAKLVHGVVFATGFERSIAVEELFVVITDIGACHILMANGCNPLANFLTLYAFHVSQHTFIAEVAFR